MPVEFSNAASVFNQANKILLIQWVDYFYFFYSECVVGFFTALFCVKHCVEKSSLAVQIFALAFNPY